PRKTLHSPVCGVRNRVIISLRSRRPWPQWTVNTFTARSTANFATRIWSYLLTSNTYAPSGTARRYPPRLRLTSSRMQLIRSESVATALACRFRIRLIHSQWRITPPPADSTQTILRLRSVLRLRGPDSRPVCVTQLWNRDYVATRLQPITTSSPVVSGVL